MCRCNLLCWNIMHNFTTYVSLFVCLQCHCTYFLLLYHRLFSFAYILSNTFQSFLDLWAKVQLTYAINLHPMCAVCCHISENIQQLFILFLQRHMLGYHHLAWKICIQLSQFNGTLGPQKVFFKFEWHYTWLVYVQMCLHWHTHILHYVSTFHFHLKP